MKGSPTHAPLEAEREHFAHRYHLLHYAESPEAPEFLKELDLSALKSLLEFSWGEARVFPSGTQLAERLAATVSGRRRMLEDELALWHALEEKRSDLSHKGLLGFKEALFPVVVQGVIVHVVRSGKWRDEPFTQQQIAELAELAGADLQEAAEWATMVPVLDPLARERYLEPFVRFRDALRRLLEEQVHRNALARQLVESERLHSLGTLSAGVAHHFNNLLSVILGYATYVLNRERLTRDATQALHKVCEAAQSGRRLTEEILAFLGSEVEDAVPCHAHETIQSVLSLLEQKTGARVTVTKTLEARNDLILVQPSVIRQIIFNLLTNALDSLPAGGSLTIRTRNRSEQTDKGRREQLVLEVTDSSGTSARAIQAEKTSAERPTTRERSSLKLRSVYGMVGRLDGTVVVSAQPGLTTRVEVRLPTISPSIEVAPGARPRVRLVASSIWVVDDDPIFREMCRQVLSDAGHKVEEIGGGKEFLERWKRESAPPDLVIIDFSMPEYNGYQLCQWLRDEGYSVPIILVSGFAANQPDIRKALKLRKTYFLQKPFSFREMADTVTVALGETLIG